MLNQARHYGICLEGHITLNIFLFFFHIIFSFKLILFHEIFNVMNTQFFLIISIGVRLNIML
jgi:hypothetical protein